LGVFWGHHAGGMLLFVLEFIIAALFGMTWVDEDIWYGVVN
jgi:hypothetical protein